MRLEHLEINGFKSFSDRSELAFDKGVTAIVGPNGCGKSNVADAITWVMGEQSAKSLRGERMEDVIFSGSDARKPTASAEVRLRFSGVVKQLAGPAFEDALVGADGLEPGHANGNGHGPAKGNGNGNGHHAAHAADSGLDAVTGGGALVVAPGLTRAEAEQVIQSVAREVEVTRRLYRSGESEYLIDGRVCRLRDVHDLLMDTGLGAKAYAIIEQGKIGMILSTRPTDRRQLIEEAAGVTKYKARRRAAELKLEAAQLNLTRVDDIVFEVEKQRGTLKRQAAKARRYQTLRDQLRRWEKVLFARKYRQLAETIESARGRLHDARERETTASARVAEAESTLSRTRIELVEAETRATSTREAAHARELAINRQQQQIAVDREQVRALDDRSAAVEAECAALEARREPAHAAIADRRRAAQDAAEARDRAAGVLASQTEAHDAAHREIEGFEADVEAARSEVFSAINAATALRHAVEHAGTARDRVGETLAKLSIESADLRIETERVDMERAAAAEGVKRAQDAIEAARVARTARDSELASARIEHEWRARSVRTREQELAALEARLKSLEALDASRAVFSDAARAVLAQANGRVGQQGAVADYLDVEAGYDRAVQACLGDLLEHVVVERPEHAEAGLALVRAEHAGRCGFLVTDAAGAAEPAPAAAPPAEGLRPLASVVRATGPYAPAIERALGQAWIADSYERAAAASARTPLPVATLDGDLFRRAYLITGGGHEDARGILEIKREIKEIAERLRADRDALFRLSGETAALEATIAQASNAIAALHAELHRQEKTLVAHEGQLQRAASEGERLDQRAAQLARERQQAEEECGGLDRRQEEARTSITRLGDEQRSADERLTAAQRRLLEARETSDARGREAAEARAAHAGLVERASGLASEVARMEDAMAELGARASALAAELEGSRARVVELRAAIATGEAQLDADVHALEGLRAEVQAADEAVVARRDEGEQLETGLKDLRAALDAVRATVAELDVARATAESDLAHLASVCVETVQATLDEVAAEADELEREGRAVPDAAAIVAADPLDGAEDGDLESGFEAEADLSHPGASVLEAEQHALSAEEAITRLREKIDRLGPVNMMAIDQYDELESRHAFLTTQRKDLVDSIAQTTEAIKRIDETTRRRFAEAFEAINRNFQELFGTLFGGGRAGLTLLDESDPLESGIEIIAQPPGKRLQSVQLLSGGEKALTAIALMFGLFKYKPSPFCLLDEIDAPLDDANIGRFVEMLKSMQTHTQFILITHNRKTMEIADRLYGVTMEEPGVSKLISVQLN